MKTNIFILIAIVLLLIACDKREWNNPFDPACPKDTWAPANFVSVQEGTTVKLTWSQPVNNIAGFKITKKVDNGAETALPDQTKGIAQYIDNSLTGGKLHEYTIMAYAGTNSSSPVTVTITPLIYGTISDIDGNTYYTLTIGAQVWMAENLKTTKYNDNTAIPQVTDNTSWAALTTPGYCWYNNDEATYKATYGALYNWYVVDATSNGGKNVCPTGWHVPSDAEWTMLTAFLGGESIAGGKLKETGTTHWIFPNTGATNETGFTALPGGGHFNNGAFGNIELAGIWWSSAEYSTSNAYSRYLFNGSSNFSIQGGIFTGKQEGYSVRCLQGEVIISVPGAPTIGTATAGDGQATVTFTAPASDGGSAITGYTVTSSPGGLTATGSVSPITVTGLSNGTAYSFTVTATNANGTGLPSSASNSVTPSAPATVSDIDGNTYNTVTIGSQVWMAENLKTTKYNDGTAISNITVDATWTAATTGAYCDYSNDPANSTTYGRLYNWYAVDNNAATKVASNGGKNVCPTSWHAPTDAEWTTLTDYLGGEAVAGGKLKEIGLTHWLTPNTGATNETNFTALPGGYRNHNGTYYYIGNYGHWWSSTEDSTSYAWYRYVYYYNTNVYRSNYYKRYGFSVRCVRDL